MSDRIFFIIQGIIRYLPFKFCIRIRSFLYQFFFESFGRNIRIEDNVLIKYPSRISLGNNISIGSGCILVGLGNLKIGNDVMIGYGSKIVTSSHNFQRIDVPMREQGLTLEPVTIGNDVWFGFDAIVLPGSIIGNGCILAAGTVATGIFSDFSIVAGVPGKIIKQRDS